MRHTRTITILAALTLGALSGAPGCSKPRAQAPTVNEALAELGRRRSEALRIVDQAHRAKTIGDLDRAEGLYRQAISIDDKLAIAWNNLGEILLERELFADAVSAFGVASQLSPVDERAEYNIGLTYHRAGWAEDALEHYAISLERNERYQPALRGAIRAAADLGVADRATHDRIRTAMLTETDPQWREYISRQRFRVEAAIDEDLHGG